MKYADTMESSEPGWIWFFRKSPTFPEEKLSRIEDAIYNLNLYGPGTHAVMPPEGVPAESLEPYLPGLVIQPVQPVGCEKVDQAGDAEDDENNSDSIHDQLSDRAINLTTMDHPETPVI